MNGAQPKVSIIMPVYNGEKYVAEAVESTFAQTYQNYELILVNDGSTDTTPLKLEPYLDRVRYICHPDRRGVCAAVNTGLKNASGELVAFFDSDDIWLPEKLEIQVDYLQSNDHVGLVHSDYQTFNDQGIIEDSAAKCRKMNIPTGDIFKELFMRSFICANTVVARKECFDVVGGFDENLVTGDYDLWLRIAKHFPVGYIRRVLCKYRQHDFQVSRDPRLMGLCAIAIVNKMLKLYPDIIHELGEEKIKRRLAGIYCDMAFSYFNQGDFVKLRQYLFEAIKLWPGNYRYYRYYAISFLNPTHAWTVRKMVQRLFAGPA
jgi:glycosyltransferase involved in cell wall biosynthesis